MSDSLEDIKKKIAVLQNASVGRKSRGTKGFGSLKTNISKKRKPTAGKGTQDVQVMNIFNNTDLLSLPLTFFPFKHDYRKELEKKTCNLKFLLSHLLRLIYQWTHQVSFSHFFFSTGVLKCKFVIRSSVFYKGVHKTV